MITINNFKKIKYNNKSEEKYLEIFRKPAEIVITQ